MSSDARLQELQQDLARLHGRSDPGRRCDGVRGREAETNDFEKVIVLG